MASRLSLFLARQPFKTIKVTYAGEYKSLMGAFVLYDPQHPLNEAQQRRRRERKKEGIWWDVTTSVDLSKSSCVRSWSRRRLRNALKEELKARGYDETGKFVNAEALEARPEFKDVLQLGKSLDLTGSIRLHVMPPLVPAKYNDVKSEVSKVLEILMMATKDAPEPNAGKTALPFRLRGNAKVSQQSQKGKSQHHVRHMKPIAVKAPTTKQGMQKPRNASGLRFDPLLKAQRPR